MSKKIVFTKDAVPPLPIFCATQSELRRDSKSDSSLWNIEAQATIANGTVYCSGNIGCAVENGDLVVVEGVQAQTRRALENLSMVLKAAGSGLEHIVKANIYLTNMGDFQKMNEVYAEFFDKDNLPARTCVAVVALPLGACFEVECTAVVPEKMA